jgi:hypothetical protein
VFGVQRLVFDKVEQPAQIHIRQSNSVLAKSRAAQHERGLIETGEEV